MAYGQRPGRIEGFDFLALLAIGILILAAAHLTGIVDRLVFEVPRLDLRTQVTAWTTGERPTPKGWAASRDRGHRVRAGETLAGIARRYGVRRSELIEYNQLSNADRIAPGDVIRIPPKGVRERRIDEISRAAAPAPGPGFGDLVDHWLGVAEPVETASASDPAPAPPSPEVTNPWGTGEELLQMAESDLRAARFEEALVAATAALRFLDDNPDVEDARRRARVEIALATVHTALERHDRAQEHFQRALAADPGFQLDPGRTSPKVLQGFEAVRQASAG